MKRNGIMAARLALMAAAILGCALFACDGLNSRLMQRHLANDQNAAAQERWNEVRGNVKMQVATEQFKAGRLDDAEKALRQVIELSPENAGAYKLATRIYIEQGRLLLAKEAIAAGLRAAPDDAEAEYLAGIVAERYDDGQTAAAHYENAVSLDGNVVEYVLAAAELRYAMGDVAGALAFVEHRIKDFDSSLPLHMLAASFCKALGLKGPAVEHGREALRLAEDDRSVAVEVGLIFAWADHREDAIETLRPLVDEIYRPDPKTHRIVVTDDPPVTSGVVCELARAYIKLRHYGDAIALLQPLVEVERSSKAACSLYVMSLVGTGAISTAHEAMTSFNRRNEPDTDTLLLEAWLALRLNRYAAAREAAQRAFDLDQTNDTALWLIGQSSQGLGDVEAAYNAYQSLVAGGRDASAARLARDSLPVVFVGRSNRNSTASSAARAGAVHGNLTAEVSP